VKGVPPDEAFSAYALAQAGKAQTELDERLRRCGDILRAKCETLLCVTGKYKQRSEMPYRNVKGQRVTDILRIFLSGADIREKDRTRRRARKAKNQHLRGKAGLGVLLGLIGFFPIDTAGNALPSQLW
jgi:hypothetical protein